MEKIRQELFKVYKYEIDRHRAFYEGTPLSDIRNAPSADVLLCCFIKKEKMNRKNIMALNK